jgi:transcriptional regulator GlxA family with amidase domain
MKFGVLVFNQVEELDFIGPWEMVTMWGEKANGPENCLIIAVDLGIVTCAKGLSILPHASFENCGKLDYLLIPGGQGTRLEVNNPAIIEFIKSQSASCKAVLSVCTGSFLLHAAGLLSGKQATTHWASLDRMRALGDVHVVEQRFVNDGNIWSSAGVSAGTDMLLAFIAATSGEEVAGIVQFATEYYPSTKRYGNYESHEQAPKYVKHI